MRHMQAERAAIEGRNHAAGLLDEEGPGRDIPGLGAQGPRNVKTAGRDISQIEHASPSGAPPDNGRVWR